MTLNYDVLTVSNTKSSTVLTFAVKTVSLHIGQLTLICIKTVF